MEERQVSITFKYALDTKVYWMQGSKPVSGIIVRRGYQETWREPEFGSLEKHGGYLTNIFYECHTYNEKKIFHESEFGYKCFTDAAEFANRITAND